MQHPQDTKRDLYPADVTRATMTFCSTRQDVYVKLPLQAPRRGPQASRNTFPPGKKKEEKQVWKKKVSKRIGLLKLLQCILNKILPIDGKRE